MLSPWQKNKHSQQAHHLHMPLSDKDLSDAVIEVSKEAPERASILLLGACTTLPTTGLLASVEWSPGQSKKDHGGSVLKGHQELGVQLTGIYAWT